MASAPANRHARLSGVVSRILTLPDGAWAEITIEGAPDLYREIRVPNPLHNEDGTVTPLNVGDRISLIVKRTD
jgi:hypothetical protein